jgi:hypothetical protein
MPSGVFSVLGRNCDKLEKVSAYDGWYGADKFPVAKHADIDAFCTKMCDTLTVLKLDARCLGDDAMDSIAKCRLLHTLHIHNAWNISDVGLMKISELHNLTSLRIGHTELITTVAWIELMGKPLFSCLRRLELWGCHTLNEEVLSVMEINCQSLEELTLGYCKITDRDEARIAQGFRTLKKIIFTPY